MANNASTQDPIYELDETSVYSSRRVHIRRLNDILHLSLERRDLPRARRAWAILARCKEFDWRAKWRTSLLILSDGLVSSQSQYSTGRSVGLLKKLMRFYPEEQESILQEIILQLANQGKFREALDELELYLPSFPYQENPILQSYAGLMSLKLAVSFSEDNSRNAENTNLLREAQKYFNRVLSIDEGNDVAKAFAEEVSKRLKRVDVYESRVFNDLQSEEEMDVDKSEMTSRVKRLRRTATK